MSSASLQFLKSAERPEHYPRPNRWEVALVGRSNAGKSSFLNAVARRKQAHVSAEPGKTRLLNFYDYGQSYRWVDMPGYGYAKRGGAERRLWQNMVESYLSTRASLAGLILVMDIRRAWEHEEAQLALLAASLRQPLLVVLNKSDKLTAGQKKQKQLHLKGLTGGPVFPVSCLSREGIDSVEEYVFRSWIHPRGRPEF